MKIPEIFSRGTTKDGLHADYLIEDRKLEKKGDNTRKGLAIPWLVKQSTFTGAVFGKYFINGQQVDKATFLAHHGGTAPKIKAPTPKQAAKQADPADVIAALAKHPDVIAMGLGVDDLERMQLSHLDDMARQIGIGTKPKAKPRTPKGKTQPPPAGKKTPPPLPAGKTPPPLPTSRKQPPPLPPKKQPPPLPQRTAAQRLAPKNGPPPIPSRDADGFPQAGTSYPPLMPHNRTHQDATTAVAAVHAATDPAQRQAAHKIAQDAIERHRREGLRHIDRMVQRKYGNTPQGRQVAEATGRKFHANLNRALANLRRPQPTPQPQTKGLRVVWLRKGWVTIGSQDDGDGEKRGGTPVFIEGGKITAGPKHMIGRAPNDLKGSKKRSGTGSTSPAMAGKVQSKPHSSEWMPGASTATKEKPKESENNLSTGVDMSTRVDNNTSESRESPATQPEGQNMESITEQASPKKQTLYGSEKQVTWATDVLARAEKWADHPQADERVRDIVSAVRGMSHAKMLIDIRDVVADVKQLHYAYTTGKSVADEVKEKAGTLSVKDAEAVVNRLNPESAAFAFSLLKPNAEKYEGFGMTAAPFIKLWLTGKIPFKGAK